MALSLSKGLPIRLKASCDTVKLSQKDESKGEFIELPKEVITPSKRIGLPIGNLTSQLFANVYLNELDRFVKEILKECWYGRYMDDFFIIHPDNKHLAEVKEKIRVFLHQKDPGNQKLFNLTKNSYQGYLKYANAYNLKSCIFAQDLPYLG